MAGYLAFALGVTAFLQKSDRRLKFFNAAQGLVYALHFVLLANLPAASSALISSGRSFLAIRFRSPWLAAAIVALNLIVGRAVVHTTAGWLPVVASCCATVALFTSRGIPLRSVMLACTLMWLANNLISRSIGGTLLELTVAAVNLSTILRLATDSRSARRAPVPRPSECAEMPAGPPDFAA
jgi:hypothetical protein